MECFEYCTQHYRTFHCLSFEMLQELPHTVLNVSNKDYARISTETFLKQCLTSIGFFLSTCANSTDICNYMIYPNSMNDFCTICTEFLLK